MFLSSQPIIALLKQLANRTYEGAFGFAKLHIQILQFLLNCNLRGLKVCERALFFSRTNQQVLTLTTFSCYMIVAIISFSSFFAFHFVFIFSSMLHYRVWNTHQEFGSPCRESRTRNTIKWTRKIIVSKRVGSNYVSCYQNLHHMCMNQCRGNPHIILLGPSNGIIFRFMVCFINWKR